MSGGRVRVAITNTWATRKTSGKLMNERKKCLRMTLLWWDYECVSASTRIIRGTEWKSDVMASARSRTILAANRFRWLYTGISRHEVLTKDKKIAKLHEPNFGISFEKRKSELIEPFRVPVRVSVATASLDSSHFKVEKCNWTERDFIECCVFGSALIISRLNISVRVGWWLAEVRVVEKRIPVLNNLSRVELIINETEKRAQASPLRVSLPQRPQC
jgi:hypothetical protein